MPHQPQDLQLRAPNNILTSTDVLTHCCYQMAKRVSRSVIFGRYNSVGMGVGRRGMEVWGKKKRGRWKKEEETEKGEVERRGR